jgi:hypothetical protein
MGKRKVGNQIVTRPLKVKNRHDFLACKWRATYCWKALNQGYSFASNLASIKGMYTKLWAPNVAKVPTLRESQLLEFQDSHLGVLRQNDIWMMVMWPGIEYTTRWKVMASPKSGPWWVLWVHVCPWLVQALSIKLFFLYILVPMLPSSLEFQNIGS